MLTPRALPSFHSFITYIHVDFFIFFDGWCIRYPFTLCTTNDYCVTRGYPSMDLLRPRVRTASQSSNNSELGEHNKTWRPAQGIERGRDTGWYTDNSQPCNAASNPTGSEDGRSPTFVELRCHRLEDLGLYRVFGVSDVHFHNAGKLHTDQVCNNAAEACARAGAEGLLSARDSPHPLGSTMERGALSRDQRERERAQARGRPRHERQTLLFLFLFLRQLEERQHTHPDPNPTRPLHPPSVTREKPTNQPSTMSGGSPLPPPHPPPPPKKHHHHHHHHHHQHPTKPHCPRTHLLGTPHTRRHGGMAHQRLGIRVCG